MLNLMAWILFASPLIITLMMMIRGAAKQRADVSHLRAQPRLVVPPRNRNADAVRPGLGDRYFSTSQNRDRAMISR